VRLGPQSLAVKRSVGKGPSIVLCHGNSCSSGCFERQFASPLAGRFRLIAFDLPGHGESLQASDPDATYCLPGYADALVNVAREFDAANAAFVGWSLGGHVVLEAAPRLKHAAGFFLVGAAPMASSADFPKAMTSHPALASAFRADSRDSEVRELLSLFFSPGYPVPESYVDDFRRTDRRARPLLGRSVQDGHWLDEVRVIRELHKPLAIVLGMHDAIVNRSYFDALQPPTLWRHRIEEVPHCGHAVQWEAADAFNRLLEEFTIDCVGCA